MEAHVRAPDPLSRTGGDMAKNWNTWREEFKIFMSVSGYNKKPKDVKANLFKNRIGPVGLEVIETLSFDNPKDKDDMDKLIAKLDLYFEPTKNEVLQRFLFFARQKANNETAEEYVEELKKKAKTCNFGDLTESLIRDKVVLLIKDKEFRKKVFETENLDLSKIMSMYKEHERTTHKAAPKNTNMENLLERGQGSAPHENKKGCCWRCGKRHPLKNCSAFGHKCMKCGAMNHFEDHCRADQANRDEKETNKNKFQAGMNKNLLNPGDNTNKNMKCDLFIQKAKENAFSTPTEHLQKPVPSAPQFPDIDHLPNFDHLPDIDHIYPDLNRMKLEENKSNSSPMMNKTGTTASASNLRQNMRPSNFTQRPPASNTTQRTSNFASPRNRNNRAKEEDPESCSIS